MNPLVTVHFFHTSMDMPCYPSLVFRISSLRDLRGKVKNLFCTDENFEMFDQKRERLHLSSEIPNEVFVVFTSNEFLLPRDRDWIKIKWFGENACPSMCFEKKNLQSHVAHSLRVKDQDLTLIHNPNPQIQDILDPKRLIPHDWKELLALWSTSEAKKLNERAARIIKAQQDYYQNTDIGQNTAKYLDGQTHFDWFMFPLKAPASWSSQSQTYSIADDETRKKLLENKEFASVYLDLLRKFATSYKENKDAIFHYPIRLYKLLLSLAQFLGYAQSHNHPIFTNLCQVSQSYSDLVKNQAVEKILKTIASGESVPEFLSSYKNCK